MTSLLLDLLPDAAESSENDDEEEIVDQPATKKSKLEKQTEAPALNVGLLCSLFHHQHIRAQCVRKP